QRLAPAKTSPGLLRIFSNVSYDRSETGADTAPGKTGRVVGVFSSFDSFTCGLLRPILPKLLENPNLRILLVGPASAFVNSFRAEFPRFEGRIETTGRLNIFQAGRHLQACDALLQLYLDGASTSRGTFLAALASGVPVVTAAGPCTERLLRDSDA